MSVLSSIEPQNVFHYFEEICSIPHGSGHTDAISNYLTAFAEAHELKYIKDASNNVIIFKKARPLAVMMESLSHLHLQYSTPTIFHIHH